MIEAGLVGCGSLGRAHTQALAEIEGARMSAFCDLREDRRQKAEERFPQETALNTPTGVKLLKTLKLLLRK